MKNKQELLDLAIRTKNVVRGSIFEGLLAIEEEDFEDSCLPLEKDDIVIDELSYLGKMFYTLYNIFLKNMLAAAPNMMEDEELGDMVDAFYRNRIDIFSLIDKDIKSRYQETNLPFPEEDWGRVLFYGLQAAGMMKIINGLVSSRITINTDIIIKQGFKVVALNKPENKMFFNISDN